MISVFGIDHGDMISKAKHAGKPDFRVPPVGQEQVGRHAGNYLSVGKFKGLKNDPMTRRLAARALKAATTKKI